MEAFPTTAGILQGNTLAPFLFVIVVDYVLRQSVDNINHYGLLIGSRSGRLSYKHLTDLDYADDLALVAEQITSSWELLVSLESAAAKVGRILNAKKTEYIPTDQGLDYQSILSPDGSVIKEDNDLKYLWSFVANSKKDFNSRKGEAWTACNKLH